MAGMAAAMIKNTAVKRVPRISYYPFRSASPFCDYSIIKVFNSNVLQRVADF